MGEFMMNICWSQAENVVAAESDWSGAAEGS